MRYLFNFLWFLAILRSIAGYCVNSSTISYSKDGYVSILDTLATCLQNIPDPILYPGYSINQTDYILPLSSQIALNNLIKIDEVNNLVQFDFFFRLNWYDWRLDMPALWEALNYNDSAACVALGPTFGATQLINGNQFNFWIPDMIFPDALQMDASIINLKICPNGQMSSSQRIVITLLQSNFNYRKFPADSQTIKMRFFSYSLNNIQLAVVPSNPPVMLYTSVADTASFTLNPIWTYGGNNFYVALENNGSPSVPRVRSVGIIEVIITRTSNGMVYRLGIPILLLVALAAIAFWASPVDRMNITVTVLLAVSALYIVVFQNIPMIGYLTVFDTYVLIMFVMLFICCILHQLIIRLGVDDKIQKWPLRKFYVRFIEAVGRVFVLPCIFTVFVVFFHTVFSSAEISLIAAALLCWTTLVTLREYSATVHSFQKSMRNISKKIESLANLSTLEVRLFNAYTYRIWSASLARHIKEMKLQDDAVEKERSRMRADSDDEDDDAADYMGDGVAMSHFTSNPMKTT